MLVLIQLRARILQTNLQQLTMGIFDIFKKQPKETTPKSAEQIKKQSEKYLKSLNIPFIAHLPLIEEESEMRIRKPQEIAERILILVYLAFLSEVPDEKENVIDFLKTNLLWDKTSPNEKELFEQATLTAQQVAAISWRSEAAWLLLWTIKKVDKLELPIEIAQVSEIMPKIPGFFTDPKAFIENAVVRPATEILDILDLTYRLHWATRNAGLNHKPMPANLNSSIVMERHYAINWVTFYADNWDDITTDT